MGDIRVFPGVTFEGEISTWKISLVRMESETERAYAQRVQQVESVALSFVPKSKPEVFDFTDTSKYRQVGPTSWEAITPGYPPEEKPTNERDIHFQEFAGLLRRDLSEIIDEPLVHSSANFEEFEQKVTHLKQIIAHRAYDFAFHVLTHMPADKRAEYGDVEDCLEHIPDLTEWPEQSE